MYRMNHSQQLGWRPWGREFCSGNFWYRPHVRIARRKLSDNFACYLSRCENFVGDAVQTRRSKKIGYITAAIPCCPSESAAPMTAVRIERRQSVFSWKFPIATVHLKVIVQIEQMVARMLFSSHQLTKEYPLMPIEVLKLHCLDWPIVRWTGVDRDSWNQ